MAKGKAKIEKQVSLQEVLTEELKATNQMESVGAMNNIRAVALGIVKIRTD